MTQLFHRLTASQFADGYSNGWVKSVDQTAGFNAHRAKFAEGWSQSMTLTTREEVRQFFKDTDEKTSIEVDWKLNQMQLVSLLLHEEARVYVSENLPDMEELSGADVETRGLSPFETDALERMRADENIVTRATPNRLQMMGALRATQECMQCHNVQEDELLGAFSYEFLRDPKLNLESKGYRP